MYACLWNPLVSVGILAEAFERQITYAQPWFTVKVDGTDVSVVADVGPAPGSGARFAADGLERDAFRNTAGLAMHNAAARVYMPCFCRLSLNRFNCTSLTF